MESAFAIELTDNARERKKILILTHVLRTCTAHKTLMVLVLTRAMQCLLITHLLCITNMLLITYMLYDFLLGLDLSWMQAMTDAEQTGGSALLIDQPPASNCTMYHADHHFSLHWWKIQQNSQ